MACHLDMSFLWKQQFPDSEIAKACTLGETKAHYLIVYCLAPHFRDVLLKKVRGKPFVLMFDESLNEEQQQKQLHLVIRYMEHDHVKTRYVTGTSIS